MWDELAAGGGVVLRWFFSKGLLEVVETRRDPLTVVSGSVGAIDFKGPTQSRERERVD